MFLVINYCSDMFLFLGHLQRAHAFFYVCSLCVNLFLPNKLEQWLLNKNIVQQVSMKYCICNVVPWKMYNIKQ